MNNKVLVFYPGKIDINAGGPSGFIAHNLYDKPRDLFDLSSDLEKPTNFFNKNLYRIVRFIDLLKDRNQIDHKAYFKARYCFLQIKAYNYKYIYFHSDIHYFFVKDLIPKEQCVIFQPHSPQLHSEEYKEYKPLDVEMYEYIQQAEKAIFERADIVILPNTDCLPIYQELYTTRNKFYFIKSGAKSSYNMNEQEKITLPQDRINLMYIGRRNHIKGFDIVLDNFRKARAIRKDIHLYLIGRGEKINEDGITDIGFSSNPIDWYNSVDYLINANRQSYFDLSIIEAISTGVPIIMSENLGHKYYKNISKLITTYDIETENELLHILLSDLKKRNIKEMDNIELYKEQLTDLHYYNRFCEFIKNYLYSHKFEESDS